MPGTTRFQRQLKRRGQIVLLLIGVVSILMMPVDYRGGADFTHPHATAQLLIDLAHGSLDHHFGDSQLGHWPVHHPRLLSPSRPAQPRLSPDPARSWMEPVSRATIAALSSQTSAATPATSDDSPSVAPRSAAMEKVFAASALLPVIAALLWRRLSSRLHWQRPLAWTGRLLAPEPPPPRYMVL